MKIYKTPPQRRKKKDGSLEGDFVSEGDEVETSLNHHSAKDTIANNTHVGIVRYVLDMFGSK